VSSRAAINDVSVRVSQLLGDLCVTLFSALSASSAITPA